MKKMSPFAALAICWFIGIVFGKVGLWFPIGIVAALVIAAFQKKQSKEIDKHID